MSNDSTESEVVTIEIKDPEQLTKIYADYEEEFRELEEWTYESVSQYAQQIGVDPSRLLKELDIYDDEYPRPETPLWFAGQGDKLAMHAIEAMTYACTYRRKYPMDILELMTWASSTSFLCGALSMGRSDFNPVALGKKGAAKRHEPMYKLTAWALDRYKEKSWPSAKQAAYELENEIVAYGKTIGVTLSVSNARDTIYKWFLKDARQAAGGTR